MHNSVVIVVINDDNIVFGRAEDMVDSAGEDAW